MTPFLVAVMGVPAPTAVGTDLTFATLTKLTGSFQHFRQRSVNLEIAVFLGLGSIPAGLLGVVTLEWISGSFDPARVLVEYFSSKDGALQWLKSIPDIDTIPEL